MERRKVLGAGKMWRRGEVEVAEITVVRFIPFVHEAFEVITPVKVDKPSKI